MIDLKTKTLIKLVKNHNFSVNFNFVNMCSTFIIIIVSCELHFCGISIVDDFTCKFVSPRGIVKKPDTLLFDRLK